MTFYYYFIIIIVASTYVQDPIAYDNTLTFAYFNRGIYERSQLIFYGCHVLLISMSSKVKRNERNKNGAYSFSQHYEACSLSKLYYQNVAPYLNLVWVFPYLNSIELMNLARWLGISNAIHVSVLNTSTHSILSHSQLVGCFFLSNWLS